MRYMVAMIPPGPCCSNGLATIGSETGGSSTQLSSTPGGITTGGKYGIGSGSGFFYSIVWSTLTILP